MKRRRVKTDIYVHCSYDKMALIDKVLPNPKNPNTHPPSQIKLLAAIMKQFGWRVPITVSMQSGLVVRGHGRLEAAAYLHQVRVPIDYQNYSSEAEEHADLVADNKIPELAKTDAKLLADIMQEVNDFDFDMAFTGYSETEVKRMLDADYEKLSNQTKYDSESYQILVECNDEEHQLELLEQLESEGLVCKALVL